MQLGTISSSFSFWVVKPKSFFNVVLAWRSISKIGSSLWFGSGSKGRVQSFSDFDWSICCCCCGSFPEESSSGALSLRFKAARRRFAAVLVLPESFVSPWSGDGNPIWKVVGLNCCACCSHWFWKSGWLFDGATRRIPCRSKTSKCSKGTFADGIVAWSVERGTIMWPVALVKNWRIGSSNCKERKIDSFSEDEDDESILFWERWDLLLPSFMVHSLLIESSKGLLLLLLIVLCFCCYSIAPFILHGGIFSAFLFSDVFCRLAGYPPPRSTRYSWYIRVHVEEYVSKTKYRAVWPQRRRIIWRSRRKTKIKGTRTIIVRIVRRNRQ